MKKHLVILSILFIMMSLACVQSQNTPKNWQWRGENRNGVYNETGLLKEWPAEGPQLLWKFEGLGEGHTSAAIAGEKIYITGMHDDILMLYVFDMTGKLLKEKEIGREWNINHNGFSKKAPLTFFTMFDNVDMKNCLYFCVVKF
jgi:hypothetical protein